MKSIFSSFFRVSTLFMIGMPLTLLVNIVLARTLSASDFGVYSFAIATASLFAIPVAGGFPLLLTREISRYVQEKDWPRYLGISSAAHFWVLCSSAVIILLLYVFALGIGVGLTSGKIRALQISIFLLPILGLNFVRQGLLKGLGFPAMSEAPNQILLPILLLLGFSILLLTEKFSLDTALYWYLMATIFMYAAAFVLLLRVQPAPRRAAKPLYDERKNWLRSLLPFAMMGAIGTIGAHLATILLGVMGQDETVAILRVAERGAQFVVLPLILINTVLGPHLVRSIREGSIGDTKQIAQKSARLTTAIATLIALVLIIFGRPLIALTFGAFYSENAFTPMVVLIAAQLISVAMGSSGIILAMAGHEKHNVYGQILGLGLMVPAAIMLAGPYGATGATIGVAAGLFVTNLYMFISLRIKMLIWSSIF